MLIAVVPDDSGVGGPRFESGPPFTGGPDSADGSGFAAEPGAVDRSGSADDPGSAGGPVPDADRPDRPDRPDRDVEAERTPAIGPAGGAWLCRLDDAARPLGPAWWSADLAADVRAAPDARLLWTSTAECYPRLLRAGVRVARCHDLELTEA
ncbi:MAG TPA: hypothetical protein VGJ07_19565, partial [Rugosimonospora sp.]